MRIHSVVTSAVIASFLLCYVCALPVEEAVSSKDVVVPSKVPVVPIKEPLVPSKDKVVTTVITPVNVSGPIDPEPAPDTTITPSTTSTTAKPLTTNATTTTAKPTTPKPTDPTTKPTQPTTPSTTAAPSTTTAPSKPTVNPSTTAAPAPPHHDDRKFDGPSFIGGIVLACGLSAIGFVAFKFYKARTEHNYHTL